MNYAICATMLFDVAKCTAHMFVARVDLADVGLSIRLTLCSSHVAQESISMSDDNGCGARTQARA